jgi:3-dehydroquinate synthetase
MQRDKKVRDGRITLILVRDIGEAFVSSDVTPAALGAFLAEACG